MQRCFLDHDLRPHLVEQFILGNEMSGAFDERDQQIEGARAQLNRCAILEQPSFIGLQLEGAEAVALKWGGSVHCQRRSQTEASVRAPCVITEGVFHRILETHLSTFAPRLIEGLVA